MNEILGMVRELLIGHGDLRDIGIRFLIFMVGSLLATVSYYIRRDIKSYGAKLEKLDMTAGGLKKDFGEMDEKFSEHRHRITDLMMRSTEVMRKESHELHVHMSTLEVKLADTSVQLKDSHETREEVYGLMKKFLETQRDYDQLFGRVILMEGFQQKFGKILEALQKIVDEKKTRK